MKPEQLYLKLAEAAPHVAFSASRERDEGFVWDGDAPDPSRRGYEAYNVDVKARAVVKGKIVEGMASLGGSYYKENERLGDIHGYLPQMLEEAAKELRQQATPDIQAELDKAITIIKAHAEAEYEKNVRYWAKKRKS